MNVKALLLISLFSFSYFVTSAQNNSDKVIASFLNEFKQRPVATVEGLYSKANNLKSANQIIKNQTINSLKSTLKEAGKFRDYKVTNSNNLSANKKEVSCTVNYNNKSLQLVLLLHEIDNNWSVQNFKFLEKSDLLKEDKKKKNLVEKY